MVIQSIFLKGRSSLKTQRRCVRIKLLKLILFNLACLYKLVDGLEAHGSLSNHLLYLLEQIAFSEDCCAFVGFWLDYVALCFSFMRGAEI